MATKPRKYLEDVQLDERSITLTPATRRMSLVCKTETPMNETLKAALAKAGLSDAAMAAIEAAMGELDKAKADLGPLYDQIVSAMSAAMQGDNEDEAQMAEAKAAAESLAQAVKAALAALDVDAPRVGEAAETLAKAAGVKRTVKHEDDLPEHLRKSLEDARKSAQAAEARVEKMEAERRLEKAVVEVSELYKSVPGERKALAQMLLSVDGDARKALEAHLAAVNGLLAKSAALGELGTTGADPNAGGSAMGQIEARAKALRESDPSLTREAAIVKAVQADPDLRKQYNRERAARLSA